MKQPKDLRSTGITPSGETPVFVSTVTDLTGIDSLYMIPEGTTSLPIMLSGDQVQQLYHQLHIKKNGHQRPNFSAITSN